jgi:hypothetical protein
MPTNENSIGRHSNYQLPITKQTNKQKFKVWLRQGSKVETTKHQYQMASSQ